MAAIPKALYEDAEGKELHQPNLKRSQTRNTQICFRGKIGDFSKRLKLVSFAVEALDSLDALDCIRYVRQSTFQDIRLVVCTNGKAMRYERLEYVDERDSA